MPPAIDLTGQRLGTLTILEPDRSSGRLLWRARCDCGREVVKIGSQIRAYQSCNSCGKRRHGHAEDGNISETYSSWKAMVQRVTNPKHKRFKAYGARGIVICERWRIFDAFHADMGDRPEGMTLDRIDPNGNYCKENCRWATRQQQDENMAKCRFVEGLGMRKHVQGWARHFGVCSGTISSHLKRGKTIDEYAENRAKAISKKSH